MPTYHMRRTEREILDRNELSTVLLGQGYTVVAMCRDGEPHIVTLSYGYSAEERALYLDGAQEGLKLDFRRENPNVCAAVVDGLGYKEGACARACRSVVVRGRMQPGGGPGEQGPWTACSLPTRRRIPTSSRAMPPTIG